MDEENAFLPGLGTHGHSEVDLNDLCARDPASVQFMVYRHVTFRSAGDIEPV